MHEYTHFPPGTFTLLFLFIVLIVMSHQKRKNSTLTGFLNGNFDGSSWETYVNVV